MLYVSRDTGTALYRTVYQRDRGFYCEPSTEAPALIMFGVRPPLKTAGDD